MKRGGAEIDSWSLEPKTSEKERKTIRKINEEPREERPPKFPFSSSSPLRVGAGRNYLGVCVSLPGSGLRGGHPPTGNRCQARVD